jgi:hypothetical protein
MSGSIKLDSSSGARELLTRFDTGQARASLEAGQTQSNGAARQIGQGLRVDPTPERGLITSTSRIGFCFGPQNLRCILAERGPASVVFGVAFNPITSKPAAVVDTAKRWVRQKSSSRCRTRH